MPGDKSLSAAEDGRVFTIGSNDRFRVETVRQTLGVMPEAPVLDDVDEEPPMASNPVGRGVALTVPQQEVSGSALKRMWSRRRSSIKGGPEQLTLSHYLTKEVLPNLDNYRMSIKGAGLNKRLTLDELLNETERQGPEDGECLDGKALHGKVIKFTWVEGVFMRCLLNIWGVMLFLRLTWVIGQAGLIEGLLIISLCNIVTIITSLSMSAVCTNGQIKAGGIYYMISRSLGPEFGGAIGLMFTLANSIAVSMYLIGFCESLLDMLEQYVGGFTSILNAGRINDIRLISCITLCLILCLAIVGMDWVTRVQMGLLVLLVASQVDFVVGTFIPPNEEQRAKGFLGYSKEVFEENMFSQYTYDEESNKMNSFFTVFAVFFPAVTGIVAGANLSGDLRDPATAIPKGTILAIGFTFFTYFVYGLMSGGCSIRYASGIVQELNFTGMDDQVRQSLNITYAFNDCKDRVCDYGLIMSQQMMETMSAWGPLIYAGCFAATLSSAIASLVGAPRVFQAVAKDKIYPGLFFFAKGFGANNDPVRGYCLVFVISVICILIGNLNQVSTLLSNFFVAAYALINFSVFHASITKNPGWRPTFKYYNRWLSLIGTILCLAVMFLMDYRTAVATYIIILILYIVIYSRKPEANWGSSAQALTFVSALKSVQSLARIDDHIKTYRPKIILLSGEPSDRPCLVDFANLVTKRLSLLTCINIVDEKTNWKSFEADKDRNVKWLIANHIKAFYSVARHRSFSDGTRIAMEVNGLGKLSPNMLLVGFQEKWFSSPQDCCEYVKSLQSGFELRLSVGILRLQGGFDLTNVGVKDVSHSQVSTPETLDPKYGSNASVDSGFSMEASSFDLKKAEEKTSSRKRTKVFFHKKGAPNFNPEGGTSSDENAFARILKRSKDGSREVLTRLDGSVIDNEMIVKKMTQFRGKIVKEGTIDVYWLYDDGGLTLLLPYILTTRAKYSKCKLRVFFLNNKMESLDEESRNMIALMTKFRITFQDVILIQDPTRRPSKATRDEFKDLITVTPTSVTSRPPGSLNSVQLVSDEDLSAHKEKTNFHLRIAEVVRENSRQASMVVMTLPIPKKDLYPPSLYMAWLDYISANMPPFLFLRGNQESVLTFYS